MSLKDLKRKPVKLLDAPLEDSKLTLKNIDVIDIFGFFENLFHDVLL